MKILIDTNVFISASINEHTSDSSIKVKHRFYDQSSNLFGILSKPQNKKIGITTNTVIAETFTVIAKAVKSTVNEIDDIVKREITYESLLIIITQCKEKMKKLISITTKEQPAEKDVQDALIKVNEMSESLMSIYKTKYKTHECQKIEANRRSEEITSAKHLLGSLKSATSTDHITQIRRERAQLQKFSKGYPNSTDSRILAEAIVIKNNYGANEQFFIASYDSGFFSPQKLDGGSVSDLVSSEISKRFNIICNSPNDIIATVFSEYHKK